MKCDFCRTADLSFIYDVPDSKIGAKIAVCNFCGLVQSIQAEQIEKAKRTVSISSGADWGNIRHGKGLRLDAAIEILNEQINWKNTDNILDIGSNRGDFILWLNGNYPGKNIVAVEPDRNIIDKYKSLPNVKLYISKLEKVHLQKGFFDLAYSSHTLEHAASASAMMEQTLDCLAPDGRLFLEVPNIEAISLEDNIEEFFMDKHTFHFNRSLLIAFIKNLGFDLVFANDEKDLFNTTLLFRVARTSDAKPFKAQDPQLAEKNIQMIKKYRETLDHNRIRLKQVTENIHQFIDRQKVAFWGGGRIFDALVRFGGLKSEEVKCLVDGYLYKYVPRSHDVEIRDPEYLKKYEPQVVIILARSSADKIAEKAHGLGIRHVIKFSDLLLSV